MTDNEWPAAPGVGLPPRREWAALWRVAARRYRDYAYAYQADHKRLVREKVALREELVALREELVALRNELKALAAVLRGAAALMGDDPAVYHRIALSLDARFDALETKVRDLGDKLDAAEARADELADELARAAWGAVVDVGGEVWNDAVASPNVD